MAETVLPYEAAVRDWLRRAHVSREDSDDLIQEAYCRLAALEDTQHIDRPDAYFFSTVRNLLVRRLKRGRIVSIETIAEIDAYADDARPSPEREAAGRLDYARLRGIMATLPERCRRIVELRKLDGCSQKEIARLVGVSESVVENEVHHGVKAILAAWRQGDARAAAMLDAAGRRA